MTTLFKLLFPTRLTNFGRALFYITNEDDYIARLTRIDQIYTKTVQYPIISERV
jgi:uncharacterized protein YozE (UPF0346 family)